MPIEQRFIDTINEGGSVQIDDKNVSTIAELEALLGDTAGAAEEPLKDDPKATKTLKSQLAAETKRADAAESALKPFVDRNEVLLKGFKAVVPTTKEGLEALPDLVPVAAVYSVEATVAAILEAQAAS